MATIIRAMRAAAASGVKSPSTSSTPTPSSVLAAAMAFSLPGFMPMLSNHPAVPAIFPPRNTFKKPCEKIIVPRNTRTMASTTLTEVE